MGMHIDTIVGGPGRAGERARNRYVQEEHDVMAFMGFLTVTLFALAVGGEHIAARVYRNVKGFEPREDGKSKEPAADTHDEERPGTTTAAARSSASEAVAGGTIDASTRSAGRPISGQGRAPVPASPPGRRSAVPLASPSGRRSAVPSAAGGQGLE